MAIEATCNTHAIARLLERHVGRVVVSNPMKTRAIAEAKRTRKSQDVDGVSLSDEGVAGARIDAESHLIIEVLFNQPSYRFEIASSIEPGTTWPSGVTAIPDAAVVSVPANVYRDAKTGEERFCERQAVIYLGQAGKPSI